MNREAFMGRIADRAARWDLLVIGGGATGLGAAVDAASRGYRTVLVEQSDFAKGTSSRSTKLIHGGVRYLRQGNLPLVTESLRERGILLRNAPHCVHALPFVVPARSIRELAYYGIGLKMYDLLAGSLGIAPSRFLSRGETLEHAPELAARGLRGGILYHDAQFDDSRMAVTLAQTFARLGGTPLNYIRVDALLKRHGRVRGAAVTDTETNREYEVDSRAVINATGVFTDAIRRMDDGDCARMITPSQGAHIVLTRSVLPGRTAIMIPETGDGRVLFLIPWRGRVLLGTTDSPVGEAALEPRPLEAEIDYLLTEAARHLATPVKPRDILSVFAGLRPLVGAGKRTSQIPRDHVVTTSASGLVTVTGGKWTTFRRMGEDAVDRAAEVAGLETRLSLTEALPLREESSESPDVVRAVREEMARTLEDVLARRTGALFLDARASMEAAPETARTMARELGRDQRWEEQQVAAYRELARGYLWGG